MCSDLSVSLACAQVARTSGRIRTTAAAVVVVVIIALVFLRPAPPVWTKTVTTADVSVFHPHLYRISTEIGVVAMDMSGAEKENK